MSEMMMVLETYGGRSGIVEVGCQANRTRVSVAVIDARNKTDNLILSPEVVSSERPTSTFSVLLARALQSRSCLVIPLALEAVRCKYDAHP